MGNVAHISSFQARRALVNPLFDARSVNLIRNTVCKDCNDTQFDQFMHIARHTNLDPLRKQIHCMVINKGKKDEQHNSLEQLISIVGIGGYRSLALRAGDYMPSDKEPRIVKRKTAIDKDMNPQGLVSITVYVKKRDASGVYHEFSGRAKWDEYAPFKDVWKHNPETGRDEPTGGKFLPKNSKWYQSPEMMLEKCAEAAALRKGWPEDYASLYEEAEFDRFKVIELTPSEMARVGEQEERQRKIGIGGPSIIIDWLNGQPLDNVPIGAFHDRVDAFIEEWKQKDPTKIVALRDHNRVGFNEFWVARKSDALEIRKKIDAVEQALRGTAPVAKLPVPPRVTSGLHGPSGLHTS